MSLIDPILDFLIVSRQVVKVQKEIDDEEAVRLRGELENDKLSKKINRDKIIYELHKYMSEKYSYLFINNKYAEPFFKTIQSVPIEFIPTKILFQIVSDLTQKNNKRTDFDTMHNILSDLKNEYEKKA